MSGFRVKEIFHTLQGEGARSGLAAVFCRFAGCNLWSGREEDRATARCRYCDTDFVGTDGPGGGEFADAAALADAIERAFPALRQSAAEGRLDGLARRHVVFTGGEPALQLTAELVGLLRERGLYVAVETNGTLPLPPGIDWITVSPKAGAGLRVRQGQELKLVWPQEGAAEAGLDPDRLLADVGAGFEHHILQPCDPPGSDPEAAARREAALRACMALCLAGSGWRLGLQTHKIIGLR